MPFEATIVFVLTTRVEIMRVRVRNTQANRVGIWQFHQPEYFEYEGEEVKPKWVSADELALTTGDPEWPVRVIQRSLIISIDGTSVSQPSSKALNRIVRGSKGDEYVVSNASGRWTCTCSGFQFRKSCRHLESVLKEAA